MRNDSIHVIARLTAAPGMRERLRRVLVALLAPTRNEAGCLGYELLVSAEEPDRFVFVERWESAAALDTHLKAPHFQDAVRALDGLVTAPPDIRRYRALSPDPAGESGRST